ncbi:MAG: divergent HNH endonuclease [Harvfovirus sp.]|uniref:Divergent HNH endonuclease n=1 Tax=Harvfovirus sp. TaxID=2487768 RepID=A0A3G5A136_9VIRU|nr:MAG: divergent HNH endonuclease [Harvfovirus sp.]
MSDNPEKIVCQGFYSLGKECDEEVQPGVFNIYCKTHTYMLRYTQEMMEELTKCTHCNIMHYSVIRSKCWRCVEEAKRFQLLLFAEAPLCANAGCTELKSKINKYCLADHQHLAVVVPIVEPKKYIVCECIVENTTMANAVQENHVNTQPKIKKVTKNVNPSDNNMAGKRVKKVIKEDDTIGLGEKACTNPYCLKIYPLSHYVSAVTGKETNTCMTCRGKKQTYEDRPEVKVKRQQKRKEFREANPEKYKQYSIDSKTRQIEEWGLDEYNKKENARGKKYRKDNPEKIQAISARQKANVNSKLTSLKWRGFKAGIRVDLSDDQCDDFYHSDCFYCGLKASKAELNGIDRLDADREYEASNCVTCCKMCNFYKGSLDPLIFMKRCEHILTYQKIIKGKLHSDEIPDHTAGPFNQYVSRAERKGFEFSLTEDDYNRLTKAICYLCGKKPSLTHTNGIDRLDNTIGYNVENCRTCCGDCNFMKNEYSFDEFMDHLKNIYDWCYLNGTINRDLKKKLDNYYQDQTNSGKNPIMTIAPMKGVRKKPTKAELAERRSANKQARDKATLKKYNIKPV